MNYLDYKTKNGYDIKKYLEENDPRKNGNIDIHLASSFGDTEVVKALLADPRVDPNTGEHSALYWAYKFGNHDIVDLLKKHGCKL